MNQAIKTYGVVINLDYSHHSFNECNAIWHKIVGYMLQEDFHIDKRMFLITTLQDRDTVCEKARRAVSALDDYLEIYNKHSFQYITDFMTIDMSDYVDLRLPTPDMGVVLKGQYQGGIYTHLH
ncbi:MAG: hypothetical protein KZQ64_02680 [gamma proteobacterium symbiont of Bathyaustriella thionipta]|nr:hypothetical protein [gamma proteobacterium symbiont of Bathyaustriella thionipta]MCU7950453.1 hypothetical protein [gamma proteobacterium symbiont of Bathyaustriella thionipta]MCU7952294.1 hypothetical protein [gamma proteobacterium symbiont of Bathyaustriella thionipta]MCU7956965.1 hypothetical protein [gamma proteobacterium symbiont of Bathyaustriella thionipta]